MKRPSQYIIRHYNADHRQNGIYVQVNECGICGGQSGTGTGFSPSMFVFPHQYRSTTAPYSINSFVRSFIIHSFIHQRRYAV